ncbi:MAG TPA: NAD(P)H-dependent oxidoreductase subunit E [Nitrospira sp.]|nr:NAD(P)H-dependent oxidoreductase subunit E [Nitrospira sp.]
MLQALLTIQQANGYVPVEALPQIAHALTVTEADIAGVLSYYPDLRTSPPGHHVIRVCMGESCMANHCPAVFRAAQDYVRLKIGETKGNAFTLEKVYCMGNCALSPTLVVDQDIYGRVEPAQIPALLDRYR